LGLSRALPRAPLAMRASGGVHLHAHRRTARTGCQRVLFRRCLLLAASVGWLAAVGCTRMAFFAPPQQPPPEREQGNTEPAAVEGAGTKDLAAAAELPAEEEAVPDPADPAAEVLEAAPKQMAETPAEPAGAKKGRKRKRPRRGQHVVVKANARSVTLTFDGSTSPSDRKAIEAAVLATLKGAQTRNQTSKTLFHNAAQVALKRNPGPTDFNYTLVSEQKPFRVQLVLSEELRDELGLKALKFEGKQGNTVPHAEQQAAAKMLEVLNKANGPS